MAEKEDKARNEEELLDSEEQTHEEPEAPERRFPVRERQSLARDRAQFNVLVVCAHGAMNAQLRQALKALGFSNVSSSPSHMAGMDKTATRHFSHVLFDAKPTDMPTLEFVEKFLTTEEQAVLIALSEEPRIDDVFALLRAGARSFLVPPFTTDMLEEVLIQATEGPQLSDAVLHAPDRNGAFTAVVLNNLYRLSVAMRQVREFPSAMRDVKNYNYALRESVDLAILFCDGNEEDLRDKFVEGCINRAKDAATRLGRLRKKLRKERKLEDGEVGGDSHSSQANPVS